MRIEVWQQQKGHTIDLYSNKWDSIRFANTRAVIVPDKKANPSRRGPFYRFINAS